MLERVCTGYSTVIGRFAVLYRTQVRAIRADSQMWVSIAGLSHIPIVEKTFSLCIDEAPIDEKYGDHLTSQQNWKEDIIEVISRTLFIHQVPRTGHYPLFFVSFPLYPGCFLQLFSP